MYMSRLLCVHTIIMQWPQSLQEQFMVPGNYMASMIIWVKCFLFKTIINHTYTNWALGIYNYYYLDMMICKCLTTCRTAYSQLWDWRVDGTLWRIQGWTGHPHTVCKSRHQNRGTINTHTYVHMRTSMWDNSWVCTRDENDSSTKQIHGNQLSKRQQHHCKK